MRVKFAARRDPPPCAPRMFDLSQGSRSRYLLLKIKGQNRQQCYVFVSQNFCCRTACSCSYRLARRPRSTRRHQYTQRQAGMGASFRKIARSANANENPIGTVPPGETFLPGDIKYESPNGNVRIYFPIVTAIILSLLFTLILRFITNRTSMSAVGG